VIARPAAAIPWLSVATNRIVVRGGKGDKDRVTMLPGIAKADLSRHLDIVRAQHQRDSAVGAGWVELPTALLIRIGIGHAPSQPISTREGRSARTQVAGSKGQAN
jgi:hypothetical protein